MENVGDVETTDGSFSIAKDSSLQKQNEDEAPMLLNPDLPSLKAVLEKADVVLHVLDARDPHSFLVPHIEEFVSENKKGKIVYILNKIGRSSQSCSVTISLFSYRSYP